MSKLAKTALAVSLALNVVLVGFIAGHALTVLSPRAFVRDQQNAVLRIVPPERARELAPRLDRMDARMTGLEAAIHEARRDVIARLSAAEFDPAAMREILSRLSALRESAFADLSEFLIDAANGLPVETRKKIADHIEAMPGPPSTGR
ncbi:MAG: periplasmic heavy metal sensor [Hyphomicrobiales bacterium]|nr:periplasmic heavy metal sensor [Hyphomicrobiales bacterium]